MKNKNFKIFDYLNNSDLIMENTFWLGVFPGLNSNHLQYVVDNIEFFLKKN